MASWRKGSNLSLTTRCHAQQNSSGRMFAERKFFYLSIYRPFPTKETLTQCHPMVRCQNNIWQSDDEYNFISVPSCLWQAQGANPAKMPMLTGIARRCVQQVPMPLKDATYCNATHLMYITKQKWITLTSSNFKLFQNVLKGTCRTSNASKSLGFWSSNLKTERMFASSCQWSLIGHHETSATPLALQESEEF